MRQSRQLTQASPIVAVGATFFAGDNASEVFGLRDGLVMPSTIAPNGQHSVAKLTGLWVSAKPRPVEGKVGSFCVGQGTHTTGRLVQNLDFDRLTGLPEMMALFDGAMTMYSSQKSAVSYQ